MNSSRAEAAPRPSVANRAYIALAGRHPDLRRWHFQWLAGQPLYESLRPLLAAVRGDVLDVGCGDKPYAGWMSGANRHFGIDVVDGPEVDAVIDPAGSWPVVDEEFDVVLCTQVLEHVGDLELTLRELVRSVRPGGEVIVTVPFIFHEHNSPHDYRRFSRHGARSLLDDDFEVLAVHAQGGAGSTLGAIALGWVQDSARTSRARMLAFGALLPLWLLVCLVVNVLGGLLDRVDPTGLFYGNVLVHARRPERAPV
ncbi:MAG: methyltransferase domain-containing protein [Solirubrobacteraceae bacterium]